MYDYVLRKSLEKKFLKIAKKNKNHLIIIKKKILEIIQDPHHYKNLKFPMQEFRRVHIASVLVFSIDEKKKLVIFEDCDNYDKIYLKSL